MSVFVDPFDRLVEWGRSKLFLKKYSQLDKTKYLYWLEHDRELSLEESTGDYFRDIPIERVLARLDLYFEKHGYKNKTSLEHSIRNHDFVRTLKKVLSKPGFKQASLDRLNKLFYATSRRLPTDFAQSILRYPKSSRDHFFEHEVERLFLSVAFKDVLKSFGMTQAPVLTATKSKILRIAKVSLILPLRMLGLSNRESGFMRVIKSSEFESDLMQYGYQAATKKYFKLIQSTYGARANVEMMSTVSGAVFSVFMTVGLASSIAVPAINPVIEWMVAPTANEIIEIRKSLYDRWLNHELQECENLGVSLDSNDAVMVRNYYDTLNAQMLVKVFEDSK